MTSNGYISDAAKPSANASKAPRLNSQDIRLHEELAGYKEAVEKVTQLGY